MIECNVCGKKFKNNLGGRFTAHIETQHGLTLEDFVVKTQYGGTAPKCSCGLCDERPLFRRGKFSKYALNHQKFKKKEELFVKKNGQHPVCKNCKKQVSFVRGKPKQYCSAVCSGKNAGFSLQKTQQKIKKIISDRYGVSNISHHKDIKEKISKANTGKRKGLKLNCSWKKNISASVARRWKDSVFKAKTSAAIKKAINCNSNELQRRREYMLAKLQDQDYQVKILGKFFGRKSKLHDKISKELQLEKLGFKSEQVIYPYVVDELNEECKTIVEINGDYVHANPKKYPPSRIIRMPGVAYTAQWKWEKDDEKLSYLKKLGYNVIVVWQSDDLSLAKNKILNQIDCSRKTLI